MKVVLRSPGGPSLLRVARGPAEVPREEFAALLRFLAPRTSAGYEEDARQRAAREAFDALERVARDQGAAVVLSDGARVDLLREDVDQDAIDAVQGALADLRPSPAGWPVEVSLRTRDGASLTRVARSAGDLPLAEFARLVRACLPDGAVGVAEVPDGGARVLARAFVAALDWATRRRVRLRRADPRPAERGRISVETAPPSGGEWRAAAHLAWGDDQRAIDVLPAFQCRPATRLTWPGDYSAAKALGDEVGAADEAREEVSPC